MGRTCSLDRQIVRAFEALLLERRAKLRESVRARMAERRTGEPRRSPEDATNAVESLGEELEVAMLDRESREAAQIDAALERLARDEYGICRSCGTVIGLGRLKALPFARRPSRLAEEGRGGRLDVCEDPGVASDCARLISEPEADWDGPTHDDEPEADVDQPVHDWPDDPVVVRPAPPTAVGGRAGL